MDELLEALAPHLLEMIAVLLTAVIGWLAAQAKARWGLEIEARHREALHSALMTGVRHALSEGVQGRTAIARAAVDYVHTSVPDALAALKPAPEQLTDMAEATLEGWRAATASPLASPG